MTDRYRPTDEKDGRGRITVLEVLTNTVIIALIAATALGWFDHVISWPVP